MTYIVNENCIKCKYTDCVEVCPVDCFYEGENMLVIHPDECIDCGVCEPECPVDAIKSDTEDGAEKWLVLNRDMSEKWPNITEKKDHHLIFVTSNGKIRKNNLEDFSSINAAGKIAIKLDQDDKIAGVQICRNDQDIILSTKFGKCIRFEAKKLRVFKGRSSKGIKGIEFL